MRALQFRRRAPGRSIISIFWWWTIVPVIVQLILGFLYRFRRYGKHVVPPRGPIIVVSNHQSHFDPVIAGLVTVDRPFSGFARSTLFKSKILAWLMRSFGVVSVDQKKPDASAFKNALAELQAGRSVLIFPEGTRTPDGKVGKFHRGAALMIRRSCATVVPVAIEGAFDVWPAGRSFPRLRGTIATAAGRAISADELLRKGDDEALQYLRQTIDTMRARLRKTMDRAK